MNFPIPKDSATGLILSAAFGLTFGILLNKGRVGEYRVIVNLFRLKDFTVMKIMLTAIVVGGLGVFAMKETGLIEAYQVKAANLLGVGLGSAIFGVGMALLGYCPGTGVAAMAAGRVHAAVGFLGMIGGGIAYAFSHQWVSTHLLDIASMGKVRLPDVTGIPTAVWWVLLAAVASGTLYLLEKKLRPAGADA